MSAARFGVPTTSARRETAPLTESVKPTKGTPVTTTYGMIGLGRMGGNMSRRIARAGLEVIAWDRAAGARSALAAEPRIRTVETLEALAAELPTPRAVWMMLPAGEPTEQVLERMQTLLSPGDVIVDGANAWYRDSQRRASHAGRRTVCSSSTLASRAAYGGSPTATVSWSAAAPTPLRGSSPCSRRSPPRPTAGGCTAGRAEPGHFAKMVHNGIEYGLMQAYAEGLALLRAKKDLNLDVAAIAESWRHGTVIRSWLLDLTAEFLAEDAEARVDRAARRRFRRRTLDCDRVGRARCPDAGDDARADGAVREPGSRRLRQSDSCAPAAVLRRARGHEGLTTVASPRGAGCEIRHHQRPPALDAIRGYRRGALDQVPQRGSLVRRR